MARPILSLLLPLFLLLLAGCAPKKPGLPIRHDIEAFLDQAPPPLDEAAAARLYADLLAHRYEPWLLEDLNATRREAAWAVEYFSKKSIYGENLRPIPPERFEAWVRNARYDALDTLRRHAIVVHPTSLRLLPTHRPIFFDPEKPGEGFPFDYNQNSALKALTPLIVSHLSMDGGWAFVRSPFALGWVPVRDIAYLDEEEISRLVAMPLTVLTRREAPLYDGGQNFLFYAKSATLFPAAGETDAFRKIVVPGAGTFATGFLPKSWSARMPMPMTPENLRCVAHTLLGEPYTWGGLLHDRDCSATTRDFFIPFGIWLPRNSADQAKVGRVVDLRGLSPRQKERTIIEKGVPFRTLLYLPGHIMLYIGHREGRAYALHDMWGIRTKNGGRIIVGQTAITDLWIGKEIPEADKKALLIRRIESMNIVTEE
jgi:hypothetical protein